MPKKSPPRGIPGLLEMLRYKRPAGSTTEREFVKRFLEPLGVEEDLRGNLILDITSTSTTASRVAWLSHTDTVHRAEGFQRLTLKGGTVGVRKGRARRVKMRWGKGYTYAYRNGCLGADDTTGVWLMTEMIRAKVPGLYIFHYGEESGGIGSSWIAKNTPEILEDIDFAVSLDRYGGNSVITHQMGRRTASDVFAWSMADALGMWELGPDDGGTFTDSENYAHLVAECTNLSVGYMNQHSSWETQDLRFAKRLRDRLVRFDEEHLVACRAPSEDLGWIHELYGTKEEPWWKRAEWKWEDDEVEEEEGVYEEEVRRELLLRGEVDPFDDDDPAKVYRLEDGVWVRMG